MTDKQEYNELMLDGQNSGAKLVTFLDGDELTKHEEDRLLVLEEIIDKTFLGFYDTAVALTEVYEKVLWRKKNKTFEDYCRARFEISRQSAYQFLGAKKVMDNVRNCGQIELLPKNEAQVRPLTKLEPDAQVEAWGKVVDSAPTNGGITARFVSEIVDGLIGKEIKKKIEKITEDIKPVVSKAFSDAVWGIVNVVREEVKNPIPVKKRKVMIDSLQRIEKLLE